MTGSATMRVEPRRSARRVRQPGLLVALLLALSVRPALSLAAETVVAAEPDRATSKERPHELGLAIAAEPTLTGSVYYAHQSRGLIASPATTWAKLVWAPLTESGALVGAERWEPLLSLPAQRLELTSGLALARGEDGSGSATSWQSTLGARWAYRRGSLEAGAHIAYLLGVATWFSFSDEHRELYGERYPDDRETRGPKRALVWFGSHRVRALATLSGVFARFALRGALGLEVSPEAGGDWANLELGQLPLVIRLGAGLRF